MSSRPKRQCCIDSTRYVEYDSEEDYEDLLEVAQDEEEPVNVAADVSEPSDDLPMDDSLFDHQLQIIEESDSDDEDPVAETSDVPRDFISPSGIMWSLSQERQETAGRQPQRNIIRFVEGPSHGVNPSDEKESFLMLMHCTLETVIIYTNLQGRRVVSEWNRSNPDKRRVFKPIDMDELHAFIGLLILLGK